MGCLKEDYSTSPFAARGRHRPAGGQGRLRGKLPQKMFAQRSFDFAFFTTLSAAQGRHRPSCGRSFRLISVGQFREIRHPDDASTSSSQEGPQTPHQKRGWGWDTMGWRGGGAPAPHPMYQGTDINARGWAGWASEPLVED